MGLGGLRYGPGLALILVLAGVLAGHAQSLPDSTLASIRFEQKLHAQVARDLPFRDDEGKALVLDNYLGRKPVVLVLGYYECPMLCTLVLNGLVQGLGDMKWSIGQQFEVVNVSINPRETPALAAAKKRNYVRLYGRAGAAQGWHFLTGDESSIKALADQVGFRFAYDPASKQYAHPSGVVLLTPEGKVARYFFGVSFSGKELAAALRDASSNKVGSPIRQLLLLCFHYNPLTGKYSPTIMALLRLFGLATMLGLVWLVAALVRRGRSAPATLGTRAENCRSHEPVPAPTGERPKPL